MFPSFVLRVLLLRLHKMGGGPDWVEPRRDSGPMSINLNPKLENRKQKMENGNSETETRDTKSEASNPKIETQA